MYLLSGSCNNWELVDFDDDGGVALHAKIVVDDLEPGDYIVVVTGFGPGNSGDFFLNFVFPECEIHDDCTDAGDICVSNLCIESTCTNDDDCSPYGLVCGTGLNYCVECNTANDCPNASDYICTAQNICEVDCDPDHYAGNDSPENAAQINVPFGPESLRICESDGADWFKFQLEENRVYRFTSLFTHSEGNINIYLYDGIPDNLTSDAVASGTSVSDDEIITYAIPAGEGGLYYLRVHLGTWPSALTASYSLQIEDLGIAECEEHSDCTGVDQVACVNYFCIICTPDSYAPNHSPEDAALLSLPFSATDLSLCGEKAENWFKFNLNAEQEVNIGIFFTHADGDIDMALYSDPPPDDNITENRVANAISTTDDEEIIYTVPEDAGGMYYLRVHLFSTYTQVYDMNITAQ